jgi:hypothetical protein
MAWNGQRAPRIQPGVVESLVDVLDGKGRRGRDVMPAKIGLMFRRDREDGIARTGTLGVAEYVITQELAAGTEGLELLRSAKARPASRGEDQERPAVRGHFGFAGGSTSQVK